MALIKDVTEEHKQRDKKGKVLNRLRLDIKTTKYLPTKGEEQSDGSGGGGTWQPQKMGIRNGNLSRKTLID